MSPEKVAFYIARGIEKHKRTVILTAQGKFTVLLYKFFPVFMDKIIYNYTAKEPDAPFK